MTEQENVTTQSSEETENQQENSAASEESTTSSASAASSPATEGEGSESTTSPAEEASNTTAEAGTADESTTPSAEAASASGTVPASGEESSASSETAAASTETAGDTAAPSSEAPAASSDAPATSSAVATENQSTSAPAEGASTTSTEGGTPEASATTGDAPAEAAEGEAEAPKEEPEPGISLEEMKEVWTELEGKKDERVSVEVTVKGVNRGGVVCEYKGVEIFIPQSHWTVARSADASDVLTGQSYDVQILELTQFDTDARRVTGTRRSLLRKELLENLAVGDKVTGHVSTLTDFGAFIDLGGVDGLLHVSEIGYERNKRPNEMLKKGEEVEVIIKKIDNGGKRISLSRKELLTSPWSGVAEKYPVDSTQKGKVVSLTDIGAFVELEPGIDGLIRPRELSWTQRVHSAGDVLSVGQEIDVAVMSVDEDKERISLSLKRAQENPWPGIVDKFSGDQTWEGEVRELSNKGAVVSVEGVEGFLPRGRMGRESHKLTEMNPGDKLTVRIVEIDPKRPSVIFGLPMAGGGGGGNRGGGRGGGRGGRRDDRQAPPAQPSNEIKSAETVGNFSLGDMLSDAFKEKFGVKTEDEKPEPKKEKPAATASEDSSTPAPAKEKDGPPVIQSSGEAGDTTVAHSDPHGVEMKPNAEGTGEGASADASAASNETSSSETSQENTESGSSEAEAPKSEDASSTEAAASATEESSSDASESAKSEESNEGEAASSEGDDKPTSDSQGS